MSRGLRRRAWTLLGALAAAVALAACQEQIQGGAACPLLCPAQNLNIRDTVLDAIDLDTTLVGYPLYGSEDRILLARRGDTLETWGAIRFDSLDRFFQVGGIDSSVDSITSAVLKLRVDLIHTRVTAPVTISVFDIDTVPDGDTVLANRDTSTAVDTLMYRPDRLIGSLTLDPSALTDSIYVPLDSATIQQKLVDGERIRLGLQVSSSAPATLLVYSWESGDGPTLRYDPSADTAVAPIMMDPLSKTPVNLPTVSSDLTDYVHLIHAPSPPVGPYLTVGGLPGRRVYLRFNIPSHIIDSSNVLRATLFLTQAPNYGIDERDPFVVYPQLVTAGQEITDLFLSTVLLNPAGIGFDSLAAIPGDSGVRSTEIVTALKAWGVPTAVLSQRAIVLRSSLEGEDPRQFTFFSIKAAPELRPRLRVSYAPFEGFGIP